MWKLVEAIHGPIDFKTWFNRAEQEEQKGGFYEISIDAKESNFLNPMCLPTSEVFQDTVLGR
jgi:hypothetical protein